MRIVAAMEKVGPKKAAQYLETMQGNRPVRQSRIDLFAGIMRAGLFRTTHQGIAFHENGSLVDGQHRLWAVVETGVEVELLVIRGLTDEDVAALDKGAPRNYRDTAGYQGWSPDAMTATIAKLMVVGIGGRSRPVPDEVAHAWYVHYQDAIDFALGLRQQCQPNRQKWTASMTTAFARAYYTVDNDMLARMAEVLKTGQREHAADNAACVLRDAWIGRRLGTNWSDQYGKTEAAIRAFSERRPIKTMQSAQTELFDIPKLPVSLRYDVKSTQHSPRAGAEVRARAAEARARVAEMRAAA